MKRHPEDPRITPAQCRAMRAWLGLSSEELIDGIPISMQSLNGFEKSRRRLSEAKRRVLLNAFLSHQLIPLFDEDGNDIGVVFTPQQDR